MQMKKRIAIITMVCIILAFALTGCGGKKESGDAFAVIQDRGVMIVGLDDSFPPMGFRDQAGEIVGFDIDLAKEAARRMGLEVKFQPVEWDGVLMSLKNRDIDLIWNGLTITAERAEEIAFSKPYLENRQIIITAAGSSVNGKADLDGKTVGLQMGSSSETALQADAETVGRLREIRKYSNNTEALLDLQAGRLDAVVADEIVGRYYIAKRPGVYRILADTFGTEEYGVGLRQEDTGFRTELDRVLDEMKADGTTERISLKWFGEDIVK